ncbi:MAG: GIY-YIG nuclease family protein [Deltaproteobacteria bacterium]|nr:GIY-YIG nuclease family protein [Deltaproteobacteria bacterium]
MPFHVYILESQTTGKLYTGQTSDLSRRLSEHNHPVLGKKRFTRKQSGPWRLLYSEQYQTRSQAMKRERFLKSGQGRQWIKEHVLAGRLSWQSPPPAD